MQHHIISKLQAIDTEKQSNVSLTAISTPPPILSSRSLRKTVNFLLQ